MIYLDMDGPLTRWTDGVFDLYGKHPKVKPGQNASAALGISNSEMWEKITEEGAKWWAGLKPQPWARQLYKELAQIDEVVILTSPSHIPSAHAGKAYWLKEFFGPNFRDYILTSRKELLGKSGDDILIDDHDHNVKAFTQAGGIGIIFPRMWNSAHQESKQAVEVVLDNIAQIYPRYTPPHVREEEEFNWAAAS